MIVTDFEIDHFREGPPLRVLDLGNGLNVALVHSQGGHDLLLDFVPSTLYGPAWPSYQSMGTVCAVLTLRTEQGVFSVERDAGQEAAEPVILDPDGNAFDAEFMEELVDGISPGNFREVFTFSLDRVGRQDESRILRMARFLRNRSPEIPASSAVTVDMNGSRRTLDELAELIGQAATQPTALAVETAPKDRGKIERDLKQADTTIADLKQRLHHVTHEIDETQCALLLNRAQARLAKIEREIAQKQPKPRDSAKSEQATIERLDQRIKECKAELKQLADEKADAKSLVTSQGNSGRVAKLLPQLDILY